MNIKVLSVSQITDYIKKVFSVDPILNSVSIRGEISNFKHHYSGHMYFTLKDQNAKIKCVMFKSSSINLRFLPEDGMNVVASGNISLYEKDGQYQLYINHLEPDGKGALFIAFEQLKKKLEQEGLFNLSKKVSIPKYPSKVGVITSSTGAAVKDIINVMTRRYPGISILIVPVMVQGNGAPNEIAKAIEQLNTREDIDVIIVGRGGGSIEELWAFNEECVARAIFKSIIPVISAVGHETDFTIADFVSDLRAPTPSAAAEMCVPDKNDLAYRLSSYSQNLKRLVKTCIDNRRIKINHYKNILNSLSPSLQINQKKQYIDTLNFKLDSAMKHKLAIQKEQLRNCCTNLESLNPLSILSRGYTICYKSDTSEILDDVKKVNQGDNIDILVKNGNIKCAVTGISKRSVLVEERKE